MSVEFSNLWNKNNAKTNRKTGASSNHAPVSESGKNYHITNELRNMVAGQTFSGEVVGKNGAEVLIMLDRDTVISAKLERELQIALGQIMSFEVKSNKGTNIALIPLFENLSADPNVLKALIMANLPLNGQTEAMVETMMKEGMSIDKGALQGMYKQLMTFPNNDVINMVEMNKLQIPMTQENIEQFSNYKNFEHKLVEGIQTIMDEIPKAIMDLLQNGETGPAAKLFMDIMKFIQGDQSENGQEKTAPSPNLPTAEPTNVPANVTTMENQNQNPSDRIVITEDGIQGKEPFWKEPFNPESLMKENAVKDDIEKAVITTDKQLPSETNTSEPISLSVSERKQLIRMLQSIDVPERIIEGIKKQEITPQEILKSIADAFMGNSQGKTDIFKELFSSDFVRNMLRNESEKQFLLKPEQVAKENKVEEYYQRLNELTNKLTQSLENILKSDNPLMKTAANLHSNVDFMNQLNQTFTYLQLPLKMGNKNANGDLYVYTNKKNLAKKEGSVSAFLHLDMEYIGAVDVHASLEGHKVTTKFYLEKEEVMDLVEANMHLLNKQLEKKGYSLKSQVLTKEKDTNIVKEMLEQNKNIGVMSKYSFDMRA